VAGLEEIRGQKKRPPGGWGGEQTNRKKQIPLSALAFFSAVSPPFRRAPPPKAVPSPPAGAPMALVNAYPDFLDRIEDNNLVWKDGTRMRIDDGKGAKAFDAMLDDPDIKDMFLMKYPVGERGLAPDVNFDPGRVRYAPLFKKIYGDCRTAGFTANAVNVVWLPSKYGKNVKFTKIN